MVQKLNPMLAKFASKEFPLRISSLPKLFLCPMSLTLEHLEQYQSESGEAADTGTGAGRGIELLHRGLEVEAALAQVMREAADDFPRADRKKVQLVVSEYAKDPRHWPLQEGGVSRVLISSLEREYEEFIDPGVEGELPIFLTGHTDQIRLPSWYEGDPEDAPYYEVWDVKCSRFSGWELVHNYAWQLTGYSLVATTAYGKECRPGGIIRASAYGVTPRGKSEPTPAHEAKVFWHVNWTLEHCLKMRKMLVDAILRIRRGEVHANPGWLCGFCCASGISDCIDKWNDGRGKCTTQKPVDADQLSAVADSLKDFQL